MPAYYRLVSLSDGLYMFSLMSANHRSILESTIFRSRAHAVEALEQTRAATRTEESFSRRVARDGKLYFAVLGPHGQFLCTSSRYRDRSALEVGVRAVLADGAAPEMREQLPPSGHMPDAAERNLGVLAFGRDRRSNGTAS